MRVPSIIKRLLPKAVRRQLLKPYFWWQVWGEPILPLGRLVTALPRYGKYLAAWRRYARLPGAEHLRLGDGYPCLFDATPYTPGGGHYFYQAVWAMERIGRSGAAEHVDVGSDAAFVGMLTTHLPVTFLDIRPLQVALPRLTCMAASILALPFQDRSVPSLSCLHVAEHIGLGRYGDPLNPLGTRQACAELARVLAPGGNLFFSLPVGQPRVQFNAHRVHSPTQILGYLGSLELVEFSAVDDHGQLLLNVPMGEIESVGYSCGLFWFRCPG